MAYPKLSPRQTELLRLIAGRIDHYETPRIYSALEKLGLIEHEPVASFRWQLTDEGIRVAQANGFSVWRRVA